MTDEEILTEKLNKLDSEGYDTLDREIMLILMKKARQRGRIEAHDFIINYPMITETKQNLIKAIFLWIKEKETNDNAHYRNSR